MRRLSPLLAYSLASLVACCFPNLIEACWCGDSRQLDELLPDAPAVFLATVESTWPTQDQTSPRPRRVYLTSHIGRAARVTVKESYRGVVDHRPMLTVFSGVGGGDCGLEFEVGRTYLFLTWPAPYRGLNVHFTDRCHSIPFDLNDAELMDALNKDLRDLSPLDWTVEFGEFYPLVFVEEQPGPPAWATPAGRERLLQVLLILSSGVVLLGLLLVLRSKQRGFGRFR